VVEERRFDRSLYLPDAVRAAVDAFSEHASLDVAQREGAIVVTLRDAGEHDPRMLLDELSNHVLFETIVRRRQDEP
jgi:hypothetical protein